MSALAIEISRLTFLGPKIEPCFVEFGPNLNVFYGPTETGKSFIIEAIDFMLGGKELRSIPERQKYDTVVLWIKLTDQRLYTLQRSTEGKGFLWSEGHRDQLTQGEAVSLSSIHSSKTDSNLSRKLLSLLDLDSKQVAISKDEIRGLSFRDLVHLAITDEDNIWSKLSPVLSANNVETPARKSVFRLALSGIDASSLVLVKEANDKIAPLQRQKEAISSLTLKYAERTAQADEDVTRSRFSELEKRLKEFGESIELEERRYNNALLERRRFSESQEAAASRYRRLQLLLSRFELLDQHYRSDLDRLEAIAEAGSIFNAIHGGNCPICGAEPSQHNPEAACNFDTESLLIAVKAEAARINGLRGGLSESITALKIDMTDARKRETEYETAKDGAEKRVSQLGPIVRDRRRGVASLSSEMSSLHQVVAQFDVMQAFKKQIVELDEEIQTTLPAESAVDLSLSPAASASFAAAVEKTLLTWGLPDADRVSWDASKFDIQIGQRRRGDRGKGIRAITCAGFILTLMNLCRTEGNPHPGFVILDSPLLAYWEPEDQADDLSQTDVDERFYKWFSELPCVGQVIIVDNQPPPSWLATKANVVHFTKSKAGRYGLFPSTG
jgi:uncharacterized protein YydD (DUF2326 family)